MNIIEFLDNRLPKNKQKLNFAIALNSKYIFLLINKKILLDNNYQTTTF